MSSQWPLVTVCEMSEMLIVLSSRHFSPSLLKCGVTRQDGYDSTFINTLIQK
jgi:hypothetical protein